MLLLLLQFDGMWIVKLRIVWWLTKRSIVPFFPLLLVLCVVPNNTLGEGFTKCKRIFAITTLPGYSTTGYVCICSWCRYCRRMHSLTGQIKPSPNLSICTIVHIRREEYWIHIHWWTKILLPIFGLLVKEIRPKKILYFCSPSSFWLLKNWLAWLTWDCEIFIWRKAFKYYGMASLSYILHGDTKLHSESFVLNFAIFFFTSLFLQ